LLKLICVFFLNFFWGCVCCLCGWFSYCVCFLLNLCYEKTSVPLQQQQILFNGNEVSNSQKLSALGVKDDDLLMMTVSSGTGAGASRYTFFIDVTLHPCEIMHCFPIFSKSVNCLVRIMHPSKNMRWLECLQAVWLYLDVVLSNSGHRSTIVL
jgi:hypothetical protein